jgi:hypothetical protein
MERDQRKIIHKSRDTAHGASGKVRAVNICRKLMSYVSHRYSQLPLVFSYQHPFPSSTTRL